AVNAKVPSAQEPVRVNPIAADPFWARGFEIDRPRRAFRSLPGFDGGRAELGVEHLGIGREPFEVIVRRWSFACVPPHPDLQLQYLTEQLGPHRPGLGAEELLDSRIAAGPPRRFKFIAALIDLDL